MNKTRFILASFIFIVVLSLLVSCSDSSSSSQGAEKTWYWDHELTGPDARIATENHTVAMHLKPLPASAGVSDKSVAVKTFPVTYKRSGTFQYCIPEKDPLFVSLTITDSTGKAVVSLGQGKCVHADIKAGQHTVSVQYNHGALDAKGQIAFLGAQKSSSSNKKSPQAKNSLKTNISYGGVDSRYAGGLAITDSRGNLLTMSPNTKTPDGHDNYYLRTVPMRTVTTDDLFYFVSDPLSSTAGYKLYSSKGYVGAYYYTGRTLDPPYMDCPINVTNNPSAIYVQSPLYTYSQDNSGMPPSQYYKVDDLGNWKFNMAIDMTAWSYVGITSQNTACTANQQDVNRYKTTFNVWFRYYADASQMPPLQPGEIALFEKGLFSGRAWVFLHDVPDFSQIQGLSKNIKSIYTYSVAGTYTQIAAFTGANYTGDYYIGTGFEDINLTSLGAGISSLRITPDVSAFVLSSQSCRYCELNNFNLTSSSMSNLDFSYAKMPGSYFAAVKLNNINFSYADLSGSRFRYVDDYADAQTVISKCNFTGANLSNANFETNINYYYTNKLYLEINDSIMDNAVMKAVKLVGVSFKNTSLVNTDMSSLNDYANTYVSYIDAANDNVTTRILGGKVDQASLSYLSDADGKRLILRGAVLNKATVNNEYAYSFAELLQPSTGGTPANSRFIDLAYTNFSDWVLLSTSENPGDLSNSKFMNVRFGGVVSLQNVQKSCADVTNLTGCADFSGAIITSVAVQNSNLKGVNFTGARLSGTDLPTSGENVVPWAGNSANFTDSDLTNANLSKVIAQKTNFTRVILTNTNMTGANFQHAIFKGSTLTYANMKSANFCYATFNADAAQQRSSDLTGSYLQNANMAYSDLSGTTMKQVSFHSMTTHANCQPSVTCTDSSQSSSCTCTPTACASAYGATMTGVNLSDSYLAGLDMSNTVLTGATLTNVFAMGANFTNADLSNQPGGLTTNLGYAFLFGANFTNAKVQNSSFLNAYLDNPVSPPTQKGTAVSYLSSLYTGFRDSQFTGKPVCPQYATSGLIVLPSTDNTMTCPDASRGPCSGSQWIAKMPIDNSKIIVTYGGSTFPAPAGCTGGAYLFW